MSPARTAVGAASPPDPPEALVAQLYGELEEMISFATWRETGSHPTGHDLDTMARRVGAVVMTYFERERQVMATVQRQQARDLAAEIEHSMAHSMALVRGLWADRPGLGGS